MALFELTKTDTKTKARLGLLRTDHGDIPTPIFMPVGTQGTVKAVSNRTLLEKIQAKIILGNTYHLYLKPGTELLGKAGGLHQYMNWPLPILTDSGGYQVFSLADNRKLTEEGAHFKSHHDGSKHLFTPENVVEIQRIIGSDIMMVLDECPPYPSERSYAETSLALTHRWEQRGRTAFLNSEARYEHRQFQFGITQGSIYPDLRKQSSEQVAEMDFEGNAIGGLSVGEPDELMYEMADLSTDILPIDRPRYLMGVGTPANLLYNIALGVDMFDCVMPTRNARNGQIFTCQGIINLRNRKWADMFESADPDFDSTLCREHSLAYMHHLFKAKEIYGLMLTSEHNLRFFLWLMEEVRHRIHDGSFGDWYPKMAKQVASRR